MLWVVSKYILIFRVDISGKVVCGAGQDSEESAAGDGCGWRRVIFRDKARLSIDMKFVDAAATVGFS